MSRSRKKSLGWAIVLVIFGFIALASGAKSLFVLVPAAMLIWYGASPTLGNGRN